MVDISRGGADQKSCHCLVAVHNHHSFESDICAAKEKNSYMRLACVCIDGGAPRFRWERGGGGSVSSCCVFGVILSVRVGAHAGEGFVSFVNAATYILRADDEWLLTCALCSVLKHFVLAVCVRMLLAEEGFVPRF